MKPLDLLRFVVGLALALAVVPVAGACPFCAGDGSGTNPVKEAILGEGFWWNAFCTGLPFGVFFAVAALLHFGGGRAGRQVRREE